MENTLSWFTILRNYILKGNNLPENLRNILIDKYCSDEVNVQDSVEDTLFYCFKYGAIGVNKLSDLNLIEDLITFYDSEEKGDYNDELIQLLHKFYSTIELTQMLDDLPI